MIDPAYQQTVFSFISSVIGQNHIIPVPSEFVRFTGDYNTAALLTQIIYWTDKTQDPDGWFYKSYEQWEEEIALNKYFCSKSATTLKKMEIIQTQVRRVGNGDTILHYRLIKESFINKFGKHLEERSRKKNELQSFGSSKFKLPEVQSLNFRKPKVYTSPPIYTKTTNKDYNDVQELAEDPPPLPDQPLPSLSFSSHDLNDMLQSIPQEKRSKAVEKVIEKALSSLPVDEIKTAIDYTLEHSKKNFKVFLAKTLENGWHDGYEKEMSASHVARLKEVDQAEEKAKAEIRAKHEALNNFQATNPEEYELMEQQAAKQLGFNLKRLKPGQSMRTKFKIMELMGI